MAARPRRAVGESHRGSDGRAVEESAATGQASGVSGLFKVLYGPLELGVSRPYISKRQVQTTCLLNSWLHVVELLWCPHLSGQKPLQSRVRHFKGLIPKNFRGSHHEKENSSHPIRDWPHRRVHCPSDAPEKFAGNRRRDRYGREKSGP